MTETGYKKVYEFGDFRLDTGDKTLRRGGQSLPVPIKAVELLALLVENRGRTVSKDEILQTIWHDTFVDENNLAVMVSTLRKTFGEGRTDKRFIETVPRRGYRFVHELAADDGSSLVLEKKTVTEISFENEEDPAAPFRPRWSRRRKILFAGLAVCLAALVLAPVYSTRVRGIFGLYSVKASNFKPTYAPPSGVSPVKMLIVRPFNIENVRGRRFDEDFRRDLIVRFGSRNKFKVRPPSTAMSPSKREDLKLRPIVEKTDFVLDGTIEQLPDDTFRISTELLDVKHETVIRSDSLTGGEIVRLEDAVVNFVVEKILDTLTAEEKAEVEGRRPTSISAYAAYLNGIEALRRRTDSRPYFQEAIRLDPEFAEAYSMFAITRAFDGWKGSAQAVEAKNYIDRALALDPQQADAYAAQGFMQIFHEFDWEGGEKSLRYALVLDPHNVNAHHWLACNLAIHRRLDEAKAEMELALELDPVSATLLSDLGELYFFSYDHGKFIELNEEALVIEPTHYFASGRRKRYEPKDYFYRSDQKEDVLTQLENRVSRSDENSFALGYINVDPRYDFIRSEPRFQTILRKINL
ncbi:MAG: winged helix-turn-helix domain-containing protein [Acidobacteria bacterium]|nr:winged helix-turn-helix domain-containing protein [Acidobacteriota bacterium]